MSDYVKLDETDIKILKILIKDARTRLIDIANECGTSSPSVLNRIKRLKNLKVITGSTLYTNLAALGLPIVATIGVHFDGNQDQEILKLIGEQTYLVEPSPSIGEYDLCALVFAKSISELDKMTYSVRKHFEASKVTINVWSGVPQNAFENIDLKPKEKR
jgi:Lrp/AsnC family transcriptional regulator for asnA, asnC and gidA